MPGDFSRLGGGAAPAGTQATCRGTLSLVSSNLVYWTVWYRGLHAGIADLSGAQSLPTGHSQSTRETKSRSSVIGQKCAHRILWKHREGASGWEKAETELSLTFGLCGRRRGWDVLREQHRNMYIIKGETDHQPRLDA